MRIVVVGGGYGGLASAARLAKLGHEVTLLERAEELGGALAPVIEGDFAWDGGPTHTLLPAVLRDLFRKTGRPLEAELDLEPLPHLREHRFPDRTRLVLPHGRGAQVAAWEELAPTRGAAWSAYLDEGAREWALLRRDYLERPLDDQAPRELRDLLAGRATLHKRLRRSFDDERMRLVAGHAAVLDGHDLRNVPAWVGSLSDVEQRFGSWRVLGGGAALRDAFVRRLATRGVTVLTGTEARDVVVRGGRAVAVATDNGEVGADAVVCAVDPRRLPALAGHVARTMPAIPPVVCHLGLTADGLPDIGHELVVHGDPMLVVRTGGRAPQGYAAWTVLGRGRLAEDVLLALAREGVDLRGHVRARVDLSPRALVEQWGGSPMGVLWQGRETVRRRLGPHTPVPGVYAAGAHATPGSGLPFVGLGAALVAQAIGPGDR